MRVYLLYIPFFLIIMMSAHAQTESIPPHLATMAKQLFGSLEDQLKSNRLSPERQALLKKSVKSIRDRKINNWSSKPILINEGPALLAEKLELDQESAVDAALLKVFVDNKEKEGTSAALKNFVSQSGRKLSDEDEKYLVNDLDATYAEMYKELEKKYKVTVGPGRTIHLDWKTAVDQFFIRVFDDGSGDSEEFAVVLAGDVHTDMNGSGKNMLLEVKSSENPVRVISGAEIEEMRSGYILGEWEDEVTGEIYQFSAADKQAGNSVPPKEYFDAKIEKIEGKIESIENTKIFKWYNPETGKIVRQEKFRRLNEPFEFTGKEYALENAEQELSKLKNRIDELRREREGGSLAPKDKHDPAGYSALSGSSQASPINIKVIRKDGYSYSYDDAVFDGRRISAKRTYKNVEDVENKLLPQVIRHQLVNNGWDPPGWLELETLIDGVTGDMVLEGYKWSLHVTYSSFFGGEPSVDSIQDPWSWQRVLHKSGAAYEYAEGAEITFIP